MMYGKIPTQKFKGKITIYLEEFYLLEYNAVLSRENQLTFQREMLPPSSASTRLHGVIIQKTEFFIITAMRTSNPTHCVSCFSGDTATCLYNSPHEDESLPRVLPGKLLTLDAQCRKDRGTSACFVSLLNTLTKFYSSVVPIFF
jgi:hypothetical protein